MRTVLQTGRSKKVAQLKKNRITKDKITKDKMVSEKL